MIFENITTEQVNSVHQLLLILRLLKVTGTVHTHTKCTPLTEFGKPNRFTLSLKGYDPSTKGKHDAYERLKDFFRSNRTYSGW